MVSLQLNHVNSSVVFLRKHLCQSLLDSTPQSPDLSTDKLVTSRRQGNAGKDIKLENKSMDKFLVKTSRKISIRSSSAANYTMEAASDGKLYAPSSPMITVKQEPGVSDQSEEVSAPSTPSTSLVKVKGKSPVTCKREDCFHIVCTAGMMLSCLLLLTEVPSIC